MPNLRNLPTSKLLYLFGLLICAFCLTPEVALLNSAPTTPAASGGLKILGLNNDPNPVVNDNKQIMLTVVDANGNPVTSGLTFQSDSPDIATVDASGKLSGIKKGYATITASMAGGSSGSVTVMVVNVMKNGGSMSSGKTGIDMSGAVYISDPVKHVILREGAKLSGTADRFAGQSGVSGMADGDRLAAAKFNGPVGVAVDNRSNGGIFIADTANNAIRKIDFGQKVTTVAGDGSVGVNMNEITPFAQARFNKPQGVALDVGGNLYIADTENHAIYVADFENKTVRLFAGSPGVSGK